MFIYLSVYLEFLGEWNSNIPLEETTMDEDDSQILVRKIELLTY